MPCPQAATQVSVYINCPQLLVVLWVWNNWNAFFNACRLPTFVCLCSYGCRTLETCLPGHCGDLHSHAGATLLVDASCQEEEKEAVPRPIAGECPGSLAGHAEVRRPVKMHSKMHHHGEMLGSSTSTRGSAHRQPCHGAPHAKRQETIPKHQRSEPSPHLARHGYPLSEAPTPLTAGCSWLHAG
jgi:hypothetical protein